MEGSNNAAEQEEQAAAPEVDAAAGSREQQDMPYAAPKSQRDLGMNKPDGADGAHCWSFLGDAAKMQALLLSSGAILLITSCGRVDVLAEVGDDLLEG